VEGAAQGPAASLSILARSCNVSPPGSDQTFRCFIAHAVCTPFLVLLFLILEVQACSRNKTPIKLICIALHCCMYSR
jgi:hypothetical protein